MRRTRGTIPMFGVLILVLMGSACGGPDRSLPTTGPVAQSDRSSDTVGQGFDLIGTVRVLDDCLVVAREGSEPVVPVFPSGITEWADGELRWAGDVYHRGDPIELGGGPIADHFQPASKKYIPGDCDGLDRFYVNWMVGDQQVLPDDHSRRFPAAR
jgi:hypothetical protein